MKDGAVAWRRWGPYLSHRQWGTVREDYSSDGDAWSYFPHDHARLRAYRWQEDGLLGISDDRGLLNFALTLWNEADPFLKERPFGVTNTEGNHGEDVKEYYFYLDNLPSHAYMKALYKYPQSAFPYDDLVAENRQRSRHDPEYELADTGVFAENRYFDVLIEYAKVEPSDILIRISATNRGPDPAPLHLLPTLWFRNTWSWGRDDRRPQLAEDKAHGDFQLIRCSHRQLGEYWLACLAAGEAGGGPKLLFTENESNAERLWGTENRTPYAKDGIGTAILAGKPEAVNPARVGTKAAAHYALPIQPGETRTLLLRLSNQRHAAPFDGADLLFAARQREADAFFERLAAPDVPEDSRRVQRQAIAGLLWAKQIYHFDVAQWLDGDPAGPKPPASRGTRRNGDWFHFNALEVMSMPDDWEFPWFAAWDLAFHCVPLALVDPEFAKQQLILLGRVWFQHPNGQFPAYEWNFGDVNPPVHAWATWQVYQIGKRQGGFGDREFLERMFHKLLLNFTWWINRKDLHGHNVFQGGFLGLDNIGVFDRTAGLPRGGHLEQADGTAWMGMFALHMLTIALELATENPVYEDIATKFFEHFLYIAGALNNIGDSGISLWDAEDWFFYDVLHLPNDTMVPLKVRSLVGLIPLFAVGTIESELLERLPDFARRVRWFLRHRPDLARLVPSSTEMGVGNKRLLRLVHGEQLRQILSYVLDPNEFLGPFGMRSLSRCHLENPYVFSTEGVVRAVQYEPAESRTELFGGNSNWRGPVWFPTNFLLVEALQRFHDYYGGGFTVEAPTGSGQFRTLLEVADDLSLRLASIFHRDAQGMRPVFGATSEFQRDGHWRDYILFHEYFNGDTGEGLGASHQTGWTALIANLIEQMHRER